MDGRGVISWGFSILELQVEVKIRIFKNFKIILKSSLIAHSIGNFILKSMKIRHFFIKLISEENMTSDLKIAFENHK